MGMTVRFTLRQLTRESNATPGPMPEEWIDSVLEHFDQGTQRAILRLYRSSPPAMLAAAGARLGELDVPALVVVGHARPLHPGALRARVRRGAAAGASCSEYPDAGHWPWLDRPGHDRPRGRVPERRVSAQRAAPARRRASPRPRGGARAGPRVDAHGAARGRLPDPRAAEPRPRGRQLSQPPVLALGFTLWDNSWYGGHHLPAYSLLAPALGALLGPRVLAALSMTVATRAVRSSRSRGRFPARAARAARCGSRSARASRCSPAACRSTSAWRSGSAALVLAAARALGRGARAGGRSRALASPVAGAFLALCARRVGAGRCPRRARALRGARASRRSSDRACSRSPSPKAARSRSSPRPSTRRSRRARDRLALSRASSACCGSARCSTRWR